MSTLATTTQQQTCKGCGVTLNTKTGPTHPYLISSPACWELYSKVLAREYTNRDYMPMHRYTVDAYAVQHPGEHNSEATKSIIGHLSSLYMMIEQGHTTDYATRNMSLLISRQSQHFRELSRPDNLGLLNIQDVWLAEDADEHESIVTEWAISSWQAWRQHHTYIASLVSELE